MPPEHALYVPLVFTIGLIVGLLSSPGIRLSKAIRQTSGSFVRGWWVVAAFIASVAVFILTHLMPMLGGVHMVMRETHGLPVFDQHPSFSVGDIYARLDAFGAAGRAAYQHMTYSSDLIFPLSLLVFLLLFATYLANRIAPASSIGRWLRILPIAWFLLDMTENSIIFIIIQMYPDVFFLSSLLGMITIMKFLFLLGSFSAIAAALFQVRNIQINA